MLYLYDKFDILILMKTVAKQQLHFLEENPHIDRIEAFVVDVNGVLRGKWVPRDGLKKILSSGLSIPFSAFAPDIWGNDVPENGLIRETGDNDGVCSIVPGSLQPVP